MRSLSIIGANPSTQVKQLAQLPGVAVTGSVPDVRPFVTRSAVNVAPLRIARGTQNKILEAMAMGVPVVTSEVAARGVDAVPGEHLLCADNAAGGVACGTRVAWRSGKARAIRTHGRARVLESPRLAGVDASARWHRGAMSDADMNDKIEVAHHIYSDCEVSDEDQYFRAGLRRSGFVRMSGAAGS